MFVNVINTKKRVFTNVKKGSKMVVFWSFFGPPWGPLKNPQKPPKTPKNTPFFGSDGWGPVKTQNRRFFEKSLHMSTIIILAKMPKIAKNCPFWAPSGRFRGVPKMSQKRRFLRFLMSS